MRFFKNHLLPLALLISFSVSAQNENRFNVLFHEFKIKENTLGAKYQALLYESTLNNLLNSNKFNLINRTPEMWKVIEGELAIQDFVDPKTAVSLGKMAAAKYYLTGNVSQFSCERKIKPNNTNTIDYYHACIINASLKIVNLESGQYEEAIVAEVLVNNDDREKAIQSAIETLCLDLVKKLSKKFLVEANITSTENPDLVVISKGRLDGVKELDFYNVYASPNEPTIMGSVKITKVSDHEATGRLLNGNLKSIKAGYQVRESTQEGVNVVKIEKKEKTKVYLNGGNDIGVKRGDIFDAFEVRQIKMGDRTVFEEEVIGKIFITEVKQDYAKGKIINGYAQVNEGMTVSQSNESKGAKHGFLSVKYKTAFTKKIKPNTSQGIVTVNTKNGSYDIDTDYLNTFDNITNVHVIALGFGRVNLVRDISTTFSFDIYNISPLKTWIFHLDMEYNYPLKPEKFNLNLGASIGYGRLKQELPNGIVPTISNGESSELMAYSAFLSGNVSLSYSIKRFAISAGLSYDYMRYNNWEYDLESNDKVTKESAPEDIIPYNDVNLSGLYYNVGVRYVLSK